MITRFGISINNLALQESRDRYVKSGVCCASSVEYLRKLLAGERLTPDFFFQHYKFSARQRAYKFAIEAEKITGLDNILKSDNIPYLRLFSFKRWSAVRLLPLGVYLLCAKMPNGGHAVILRHKAKCIFFDANFGELECDGGIKEFVSFMCDKYFTTQYIHVTKIEEPESIGGSR